MKYTFRKFASQSTNHYVFSSDKIIPPTFSRKLKAMHSIIDKPIEMDCKVSGSAPLTISWYHNDKPIESGPNYEISFVENTCTLKLPILKLSNAGSYKCKAENSAGTAETTALLDVKG